MLEELKMVFFVQKQKSKINKHANHVYVNEENLTMHFSEEFGLLLNKCLTRLEEALKVLQHAIDLIRSSDPSGLSKLVHFLVDLNEAKQLYTCFSQNIRKLSNFLNAASCDKLFDNKLFLFYHLINEYKDSNLMGDFFQTLLAQLKYTKEFCVKLESQLERPESRFNDFNLLNSLDMNIFCNPKNIMKKLLFNVYNQFKSDENLKHSLDKQFLLEVCAYLIKQGFSLNE